MRTASRYRNKAFACAVLSAALAAYAWMAFAGQLPHSHGALESEEQCPLHLFAKQAQGQIRNAPPPVFSLLYLSDITPFCEDPVPGTILVPGSPRAPPQI